jgi:hypothetical protein
MKTVSIFQRRVRIMSELTYYKNQIKKFQKAIDKLEKEDRQLAK